MYEEAQNGIPAPRNYVRGSFCPGSSCVEVAMTDRLVYVRDSKDRDQAPLTFTRDEWAVFITSVKFGEFDVDELYEEHRMR